MMMSTTTTHASDEDNNSNKATLLIPKEVMDALLINADEGKLEVSCGGRDSYFSGFPFTVDPGQRAIEVRCDKFFAHFSSTAVALSRPDHHDDARFIHLTPTIEYKTKILGNSRSAVATLSFPDDDFYVELWGRFVRCP